MVTELCNQYKILLVTFYEGTYNGQWQYTIQGITIVKGYDPTIKTFILKIFLIIYLIDLCNVFF